MSYSEQDVRGALNSIVDMLFVPLVQQTVDYAKRIEDGQMLSFAEDVKFLYTCWLTHAQAEKIPRLGQNLS